MKTNNMVTKNGGLKSKSTATLLKKGRRCPSAAFFSPLKPKQKTDKIVSNNQIYNIIVISAAPPIPRQASLTH